MISFSSMLCVAKERGARDSKGESGRERGGGREGEGRGGGGRVRRGGTR